MAYTTINKGSAHFKSNPYTGTGSSMSVTGVGFRPDWLWIKTRNATNASHIVDVVRGAGYAIASDLGNAQYSSGVTSFDSDGFSLVGNTGAVNNSNGSTTYSALNWLAGGSQGSSNTDGSINTTYTSVNTTAGFSISQYTGTGSVATVGHGLGAKPAVIVIKRLDAGSTWRTYHKSLGATKNVPFENGAALDQDVIFNDTEPTSSVFTIGTASDVNSNGGTNIAYCFTEKVGYSRFGDYTGNGSTDGPFIYTGFKPAMVYVKNTSATANWVSTDNGISFNGKGSNESTCLFPSSNSSESDAYGLQLYSNGFAFKGGDSASATVNASGNIYIYWAIAEVPLVGTNNIPATAR